jgi:hypothetical protein
VGNQLEYLTVSQPALPIPFHRRPPVGLVFAEPVPLHLARLAPPVAHAVVDFRHFAAGGLAKTFWAKFAPMLSVAKSIQYLKAIG